MAFLAHGHACTSSSSGLRRSTGQEEDSKHVFQRLEERLRSVAPMATMQHRWMGQVVETDDGLPCPLEITPGIVPATARVSTRLVPCWAGRRGNQPQLETATPPFSSLTH